MTEDKKTEDIPRTIVIMNEAEEGTEGLKKASPEIQEAAKRGFYGTTDESKSDDAKKV